MNLLGSKQENHCNIQMAAGDCVKSSNFISKHLPLALENQQFYIWKTMKNTLFNKKLSLVTMGFVES